jgi:hypothetical protein
MANPGELSLHALKVEGRDMKDYFTSMLFQEHLFSPFVRGAVSINQYEGAQFYFDGSKPSDMSFSTPEGDKRTYKLLTNGVGSIHHDENQRSRTFTIDFVSKHAILSNSTPNYQKSFKNMQVSDMIKSVLKDGLGMDIKMNIDATRGLQGSDYQPIILTQKSPLRHIDDLRRMAVSSNDYDGFLAYSGIGDSGNEEFFFKSIYDLIKGSSVAKITNLTNFEMNSSLNTTMMNNVMEMWYPKQTSQMQKTASFTRGTTMFDMNKARADIPRTQGGTARQKFGSNVSLNPGNLSGFVTDPHNGMPGTGNVILEDSRRPNTHRPETAAYTEALFADMTQNYLTVKIPGNSNLRVGQIVDFDMRENTDDFANKDTKFSGKNLITGISHYIGPVSDVPRYVTYLDLVNIQTANKGVA